MADVKKIAQLARIKAEEVKDIPRILSYIEKLNSVDVKKTEPLFHFLEMKNIVREDKYTSTPTEVRKMMMSMGKDKGDFLRVESIL